MPIGILFWVIMTLWLLFGIWWRWQSAPGTEYKNSAGAVLCFLAVFLLGWRTFGFIVQ